MNGRLLADACVRLFIVILATSLLGRDARAATRIPINIDEPFEARGVAWPLTTGIPFPRGALKNAENCRLVDDTGEERPLQSRVAATWDASRESIRWLTIDFIAEPTKRYWIEFGPQVTRTEFKSPVRIDEQGELLAVSTGELVVEFAKQSAAALQSIRVDLNGDGRIDADEDVAAGDPKGEHYYLDQEGRRFSSAFDGNERRIVVERTGPVRWCVRVDGLYSNANGERIVRYRPRYHFFAGLSLIKLVDEFQIVGSTTDTQFTDIGFALRLAPPGKARTVTADVSGVPGNQTATVSWRPETESVSAFQATYRHYGNSAYEGGYVHVDQSGSRTVAQPDRIGEWMQVADDHCNVTGSLRWLWQQFPKEWECKRDELILHLWSPRSSPLDFGPDGLRAFFGKPGREHLLVGAAPPQGVLARYKSFAAGDAIRGGRTDGQGINKHHEIYLHFAAPGNSRTGAEYGKLAAKQPLALATGEWNCATDVFGPLMPRPNESKYEAVVDRLFDLSRYAQHAFGDYGWWVFGSGPHYVYRWDPKVKRHHATAMRFEFHTYQKETQLWWNYLRSGKRKFYDWAIPSENHWVDIAVSHVPLMYECDWMGGDAAVKTRTLHWPPGDWTVDSSIHFDRNHNTAEAWLRGGSQFWASYHRTLETTTLAYYLTGDERFNDVVNYWRVYWGELAGVTDVSDDVKPWHREQAWYLAAKQARKAGAKPKVWAEMIRDYAPFSSGMRHQMTLFFSLATLYEHTWDPRVKQVLQEYADAFLEPDGVIGVWQSQDNRGPVKADAPWMAHFWLPALWKYYRVTGDPRMERVLSRYFERVYAADPFRGNIGVYSNVHLGYGYYFRRDPRFLMLAQRELDDLMPYADPLSSQAEIGQRINHPATPVRSFTAIPRLVWALHDAKKNRVAIPSPPVLNPQRTAIAFQKHADTPLQAALWGFDGRVTLIGPDGKPCDAVVIQSKAHSSQIQPFDRTLPGFAVYMHTITIPAHAKVGYYILNPHLETGILSLSGSDIVWINALHPVSIAPNQPLLFQCPPGLSKLALESVGGDSLHVSHLRAEEVGREIDKTITRFAIGADDRNRWISIENRSTRAQWIRIVGLPPEQCWVGIGTDVDARKSPPSKTQTASAIPPPVQGDPDQVFIPGRFKSSIQIVGGRRLSIPDHVEIDGRITQLFDLQQGTVELWVKMLSDRRMSVYRPPPLLTNGYLSVPMASNFPFNEWAHIAIVWHPTVRDPDVSIVHIYVNGLDTQYYRSVWWDGYGSKAGRISNTAKWLKEFLLRAAPGGAFAVDELRVSSVPRYADLNVAYGPQQTFNPHVFQPPQQPFKHDEHTKLLFHFDDDLKETTGNQNRPPLTGRFP